MILFCLTHFGRVNLPILTRRASSYLVLRVLMVFFISHATLKFQNTLPSFKNINQNQLASDESGSTQFFISSLKSFLNIKTLIWRLPYTVEIDVLECCSNRESLQSNQASGVRKPPPPIPLYGDSATLIHHRFSLKEFQIAAEA